MMEYWKVGILGGVRIVSPPFQYSNIPLFQRIRSQL